MIQVEPPCGRIRLRSGAFSLVEILITIALMALLMAFVVPAITGRKEAANVSKVVYDMAGAIEEARAYAIVNNTYVWVGIAEVDQSRSETGAQATGIGRVGLVAVASKDGSQIYDESDPGGNWAAEYNRTPKAGRLISIGRLLRFENIHIANGLGAIPATGKMARPQVSAEYQLGSSTCFSSLIFPYPLGSDIAGGQYNFSKVIQFDPQGTLKIVNNADSSSYTPEWIEISLQQTHGSGVPPVPDSANSGNHAAIQIDGLIGAVKIYRP
jgi:Tfp pilus assembly protein FimT